MSTEGRNPDSPSDRAEAMRQLQIGLRRLTQELHRLNDAVGAQIDLLPGDLAVLDVVDRNGPISPRGVSDRTGIHPATLTGILDRLENGGWIRRQPHPVDRRKINLGALPARGGELYRLYGPMSRALASICAGYTEEELTLIVGFLESAADAGATATDQVGNPGD